MSVADKIALLGVAVSFTLGVISFVRSGDAQSAAEESNRIATDSNKIALGAARVAGRSEERQIERKDVVWQLRFRDPVWTLTNTGLDAACEVNWIARANSDAKTLTKPEVGPTEEINWDLFATIEAERERAAILEAQFDEEDTYGVPIHPKLRLQARVVWKTPAGTPQDQTLQHTEVYLN
jgi:hypothetical protein